jgi:serine/threonine protein kinase
MTGDRNIPLKGKRQSKPISKPLFNLIVKRAEHSIVEINIGKDNPKKFALVNSFSEEEWNGEWGKTFRDKYPGLAKKVLEDKNSKNTKKYKLVIGQGNYGKVRLAREIDVKTGNPGKYVIVKKQRVTDDESKENARAEYWFQTKYLPPNEDFYVRTLAGAETTNKKGEPTIYTFMEIADSGDGDSIIKQLHPTSSEPKKQTIDGDEIETYENEKQPVGFGDSEDKKILFLRFLSSATTSLKKLHDKNIRHRDIKPGNYLYFSNGDIKLADFGAAISTQKDAESYVSGNFDTAYWSLEMIKKEGIIPNLDLWALKDSWALGITFLQAYYGVIREIKKDGGLYIKVLNPKGANLAEYFKKIGNPDNWKTVDFLALLSPLIENISDPDLKILIQGLLESDMSKRFSLEQAEQNLQPILKKSKDTQDKAVRTDEQLAKKETAAQLPAATISSSNPNPQPPKAATVVMSGPRAITPDEERRLKEHLTALERVYVKKDNDNKPIEDKDGKTIRDDEAQPLLDARQAIIRMVDDNPAILYSLGDNKIDLIIKILESTPPDKQFDCFKIVLSTCKTLISYKRVFDLLEKTNLAFANKSKLITICVDSLVDSLAESSEIIKNDIEALRSNLAELYTLIKLLNISVSETNTSSIRNKMSSLMENIGLGENSKIDLPAMRSSNDTLHSSKQEITVETYQKIRAQLDKL